MKVLCNSRWSLTCGASLQEEGGEGEGWGGGGGWGGQHDILQLQAVSILSAADVSVLKPA